MLICLHTVDKSDRRGQFLANVILTFTFAICHRPSVVCLSVTLVHPTQLVEIFGNFFHSTLAQGL